MRLLKPRAGEEPAVRPPPRVALVFPTRIKSGAFYGFVLPALGLERIGAHIEDVADVELFDIRFEPDLIAKLAVFQPSIVAINIKTTMHARANYEVARQIREALPAAKLVAGGLMILVRESGLASLTMKKVADRIGFSETAAYRYFPNKRALLVGLADEIGKSLLSPVRSIAQSEVPPAERLDHILRHHVDFVLKLDGLPMLLLAEAAATGEKDLLARLGAIVEKYLALVTGVIEEARPPNGPIRASDLSLLVMGIPASLAIRRKIGPDPALENRVRTLLLPFLVRCVVDETQGR
jgi:AcrR family transcriptional regulator